MSLEQQLRSEYLERRKKPGFARENNFRSVTSKAAIVPPLPVPEPVQKAASPPKRDWLKVATPLQMPARISYIQRIVAHRFGVTVDDILSERRNWHISLPRHVAIYLARKFAKRSVLELGRCFGRDHSSISHAYKHIDIMRSESSTLDATLNELGALLEPRFTEYCDVGGEFA